MRVTKKTKQNEASHEAASVDLESRQDESHSVEFGERIIHQMNQ